MALYDSLFGLMDCQAAQVLVTSNDFADADFRKNLSATTEDLLSMNVVPVFNENDAISSRTTAEVVRGPSLSASPQAHTLDLTLCTLGPTLLTHLKLMQTAVWLQASRPVPAACLAESFMVVCCMASCLLGSFQFC